MENLIIAGSGPAGAIKPDQSVVHIDDELCIRCSQSHDACPVNAITYTSRFGKNDN